MKGGEVDVIDENIAGINVKLVVPKTTVQNSDSADQRAAIETVAEKAAQKAAENAVDSEYTDKMAAIEAAVKRAADQMTAAGATAQVTANVDWKAAKKAVEG